MNIKAACAKTLGPSSCMRTATYKQSYLSVRDGLHPRMGFEHTLNKPACCETMMLNCRCVVCQVLRRRLTQAISQCSNHLVQQIGIWQFVGWRRVERDKQGNIPCMVLKSLVRVNCTLLDNWPVAQLEDLAATLRMQSAILQSLRVANRMLR